jgi:succinate dehydrogenase / fumarate reductase flavoprotein subunit
MRLINHRLTVTKETFSLADGYFVLPYTIGDYLATAKLDRVGTDHAEFARVEAEANGQTRKLLAIKGKRSVDSFHRELGKLLWDKCGMARNEAGLKEALARIPTLREEYWKNVTVPGSGEELNQELEKAGRVADFIEFAGLLVTDALHRSESCGGHFREESQTPEGEAARKDDEFSYVAAWEWKGAWEAPALNKEPLTFEHVKPAQRSYK